MKGKMQENNQLVTLIEKTGLEPAQQKPLLDGFGDMFVKAHKLVAQSKAIKVTSIDQIAEMKKAHELRMKLQKIRTDADKARISLKEGYLRGANAVQGIFNDIKDIVKPEEERLLLQEKFAELIEKQKLDEQEANRKDQLLKYTENISFYDLRNMDDQTFNQILESQKQLFENKKAEEEKAEKYRIEQEEKQRIYQERRIEIAPYIKYIPTKYDGVDKSMISKEDWKKLIDESKLAKKKHDDEINAQLAQAKKDREAREVAEAKLKQQQEAIAEQKRKEEAEKEAKEAADRKAKADAEELQRQKLLAPDKDKLMILAQEIDSIQLPAVSSKEAMAVIRATEDMLNKVTNYIREKAKTL